jgi:transcriptional regulator with XRE-family HTH domain
MNTESNGPDPLDVAIGSRVRARRRMLGLSQTALGEELGVTFQQVQKYERGINRISGSTLIRLGRVLGVPAGSLLGDDEATHGAPPPWADLMKSGVAETIDALASVKSPAVRRQIVALARALAENASSDEADADKDSDSH